MRESQFFYYSVQFASKSKSVLIDFHNTFLYGYDAKIMHKGKPKQMSLYLDNYKDNLLWVSSKSKGSVIDLYFTKVQHRKITDIESLKTKWHYFNLSQFSDEFTLIFEEEGEMERIFNLFKVYSESLRVKDPHYCSYFSTICKKYAIELAKTSKNEISEGEVQRISLELGLHNKEQNNAVLGECLKKHTIRNSKMISIDCIDDYFKIQFCSRKLQPIFEKYANSKLGEIEKNPSRTLDKIMSLKEFESFLRESQKEPEQIIIDILRAQESDLSFFDFCRFLYDEVSCSIQRCDETDESYPLNYYFCYSSHNTYLSGNQLTSDCKVERYEEDLDNGVKCVQLDIHNDGNKPIVTHAIADHGFCEPIMFEDVIKQIDRYSEKCKFEGILHYPIILSLENHASEANKENILNILTKYCGDTLFMLDEKCQNFPSLHELKGRIIVKTSSKYSELRSLWKGEGLLDLGDNAVSIDHLDRCLLQMSSNYPIPLTASLQASYSNFGQKKAKMQRMKTKFDRKIKKYSQFLYPISSMSKITSIFKAQEGIKTVNSTAFQCTSLTNAKVLKKDSNQIIAYTKRSWLRTYPLATEINSDNYNPAPMFKIGAQIIALNTQKKDDSAWMTHAYFCGGRFGLSSVCGYVLKPRHLLPDFNGDSAMVRDKHEVTVKVVEPHGYTIRVRFAGDIQDMKNNQGSTGTFNVAFLDEGFLIFDISNVYKACVALRFLAQGYRVIEIKSQGTYLDTGGRIIVHVAIRKL